MNWVAAIAMTLALLLWWASVPIGAVLVSAVPALVLSAQAARRQRSGSLRRLTMFDAFKAADFSPIEQLLAAAIIVLALLVPWWIAALAAAALGANGAIRLRADLRNDGA